MTDIAIRRALQAANELIRIERIVSCPVNVKDLAKKHAHLLLRDLDDDLSGMLLPLHPSIAQKAWAIVVNKKHPQVRQRFTIAHELGHLLMHGYTAPHADTRFRIRLRDASSSSSEDIEEIQANRFAAELLMPEHLLVSRLDLSGSEYVSRETVPTELPLTELAAAFGVSQQALSIRLSHLLA